MSFLLDTNVLSEVRRRSGDAKVTAWFAATRADALYTSALVIGEIRYGIERLNRYDAMQAARFGEWLDWVKEQFSHRILPISSEIAEEWGRLNVPDKLPLIDGLIAATAKVHGLTLVTRNTQDVARTGVRVLNPWAAG